MALQWAVVILDLVSTPGTERQQDLVQVQGVDMLASSFQPTTSPKPTSSHLTLSFPTATPNLHITEMMEVWAGWRDDVTDVWSNVDPNGDPAPVYGGYIVDIDSETVEGGEKVFSLTLNDYGILLKKNDVLGWPTFVVEYPTTSGGIGYPAGYSVADWLIGYTGTGAPYNGVVRAHLGAGTRYDGVDPLFSTIIIEPDTLPGYLSPIPSVGAIYGYFGGGGTTVDSVVQEIAKCAVFTYYKNYSGAELVLGYWMGAAIGSDDTRVVPRFFFANTADLVGTPDFVVATDADESLGEYQMITPHSHERRAGDIATRVSVFGQGGDLTAAPPYPLVYADYLGLDHALIYPTAYHLDPVNNNPGWGTGGGPLFDKRIHTAGTAAALARFIENKIWGAEGSITFRIDRATTAGERARVRDPNEAIDRTYVVTEAEGPDADGLYRVRVGFTQPTLDDVMKGGLTDVALNQEDLYFESTSGTRAKSFWPGQAVSRTLENQPQHDQQNWITPADRTVPGLTLQATSFNPANMGPGLPEAPETAPLDAPIFRVKPMPDYDLTPPVIYPPDTTWISGRDGRPHPNVILAGAYVADGTFPLAIFAYQVILSGIDIKGPGHVTIYKNGTAVAGPYSAGHTYLAGSPAGLTFKPWNIPFAIAPDDLSLALTGTDPVTPTFVTLWEATS